MRRGPPVIWVPTAGRRLRGASPVRRRRFTCRRGPTVGRRQGKARRAPRRGWGPGRLRPAGLTRPLAGTGRITGRRTRRTCRNDRLRGRASCMTRTPRGGRPISSGLVVGRAPAGSARGTCRAALRRCMWTRAPARPAATGTTRDAVSGGLSCILMFADFTVLYRATFGIRLSRSHRPAPGRVILLAARGVVVHAVAGVFGIDTFVVLSAIPARNGKNAA